MGPGEFPKHSSGVADDPEHLPLESRLDDTSGERGLAHVDDVTPRWDAERVRRTVRVDVREVRRGGTVHRLRAGGDRRGDAEDPLEVAVRVEDLNPSVRTIADVDVVVPVDCDAVRGAELAAARAEFLASKARLELAAEIFERDERLFKEKVGTERQVLAARQGLKETQIQLNLAENVLHALGYSREQVARTGQLDDMTFADYELTAPIGGMVTKRHLTMGEVVEPTGADSPFIIADLSSVWVNLTVYQRDLARVHAPQEVRLKFGHTIPDAVGKIAFVSPALDEATRTATARIPTPYRRLPRRSTTDGGTGRSNSRGTAPPFGRTARAASSRRVASTGC